MKRLLYLGLAALLLPALVACKGGGQQTEIVWQDGEVMAVAFLGYYDSFGSFEASPSYPRLSKAFPQIVEAAQVVCGLGREIYLVVPRDPMATLAVNEAGEYVTDANREVFYRLEEGKPVLLLNNWYETNSQLVCTDHEGRSVTYSPAIDPESGVLVRPADGSVHDISLPLPKPMEGYTFFDYGVDFDDRSLGIQVSLKAGQPILTSASGPLTFIGFEEDSIVLADGDKVFEGINGLCKGVFLGTIGQDYNPVACVVMDDGTLKMCTLFYAMRHGGPELSGVLPGFKDVTGFESGGGGPWEDEESGETLYEYETIYVQDARGGRTELPYFADYGVYLAEDENFRYEVTLTPDWRYSVYQNDAEEYFPYKMFFGSFSEKEAGEDVQRFAFRRAYGTSDIQVEQGDLNYKYDYTPVTGTFTATRRDLSYEVSLTGSDAIPSGTVFQDERLMESYYDE